jgi:predicted hydrocarbon binding protein
MRHVQISQDDLRNIRELYEGVMSKASDGLFFKEGAIIGEGIANKAIKDRLTYFETCRDLLIQQDWVHDIKFGETQVHVQGSIESVPETVKNDKKDKTCHRLRGIIRKIYETYRNQKVYCKEMECASVTSSCCVFEIGTMEMWK